MNGASQLLRITLVIAAFTFAAEPAKRTNLTDVEKLELFNSQGDMTALMNKARKIETEFQAVQTVYAGRVKILAQEHAAFNCQLDEKLNWTDCKAVGTKPDTKK